MLSGHAIGLHERSESDELLLEDPVSEVGDEEELSGKVLFAASFEELAKNHVQYDTIIWVLISLLLVLAWGVGIIMLLYLPVRRYVLQKDVSSRRLYVTSDMIVYKATRPSFLPFLGLTKIEKRIPLHLVIDIIIEQGCLQSNYGIHTFRLESVAYGKAAPVDELQFQGVSNPGLLRKVIIIESTKSIQEVGNRKSAILPGEGMSTPTSLRSLADIPPPSRWQSPSMRVKASPRRPLFEAGGIVPGDLLLHKIEEVKRSVKKLESVIVGSHSQASQDDC
ncbi:hypothetical protein MUK42_04410 [Musa troglodytarum]|uniref:DUF7642 domain-containing protein n=1 Tax=Musa troglodytarum TaxID=320322 RepID=A0A9E7FXF3_9LILI|nr:hypothetical protein MUK42_04410 [Musa troglodytarum]URE04153.1 hypothetical protein MUK42_04410 [Musa troglodytarum]URE04154.1 hypothetical protein MUK42_04410 [Musa troglodytarum]